MHAPTGRRLAALLLAAGLVAAVPACSSDDGDDGAAPTTTDAPAEAPGGEATTTTGEDAADPAPTAEPELVTDGDLYAVPDPLPAGEHGQLLRYQEVTPSILDGATTWRVMYLSESLEGDPIAVTGTVLVPEGEAPEGGRPLLSLAHGTTGVADECAPSKEPGGELLLARRPIDDGWLVAATDYEGLGTPGRHPYLVGESEGRSVVDAILAARQLPGAEPSDRLAVAGYSQGGHGALWAGQVAPAWAPELDLVGTFAGAPATEMGLVLGAAPAGFAFLMIAGYGAAYPEATASSILTPAGEAALGAVDEGCTGDVFGAVAGTPRAELIRDGAAGAEPWKTLTTANDPGRVRAEAPVLIIHSEADTTVPIALSAILVQRMCGLGQEVERRVLPEGSHVGAAPEAYLDGFTWLGDRFDGAPLPGDSCAG